MLRMPKMRNWAKLTRPIPKARSCLAQRNEEKNKTRKIPSPCAPHMTRYSQNGMCLSCDTPKQPPLIHSLSFFSLLSLDFRFQKSQPRNPRPLLLPPSSSHLPISLSSTPQHYQQHRQHCKHHQAPSTLQIQPAHHHRCPSSPLSNGTGNSRVEIEGRGYKSS